MNRIANALWNIMKAGRENIDNRIPAILNPALLKTLFAPLFHPFVNESAHHFASRFSKWFNRRQETVIGHLACTLQGIVQNDLKVRSL